MLRRLHDEQWMDYLQPFPWGNEPFLAFVCGVPVGVAVWFLTADGMPTWLRNFYVLPSFVAAVLCALRHPLLSPSPLPLCLVIIVLLMVLMLLVLPVPLLLLLPALSACCQS